MIRVRVAAVAGSAPREVGAEMMVGPDRVTGSIGGGSLEWMAIDRARQMLAQGEAEAEMDLPLGPAIGQCCGGRVRLTLDRRPATPPPPAPAVLILGAGHVGRALAAALAPLPLAVVLIDGRPSELAQAPAGVPHRLTPLPEAEIRAAPPGAGFVIATHDHALDFLLAAEALARGDARYVGMIGSASKRAAFATHARARGIDPAALVSPIGAGPLRDKRPAVIAAMAAAEIAAAVLADAAPGRRLPPTVLRTVPPGNSRTPTTA